MSDSPQPQLPPANAWKAWVRAQFKITRPPSSRAWTRFGVALGAELVLAGVGHHFVTAGGPFVALGLVLYAVAMAAAGAAAVGCLSATAANDWVVRAVTLGGVLWVLAHPTEQGLVEYVVADLLAGLAWAVLRLKLGMGGPRTPPPTPTSPPYGTYPTAPSTPGATGHREANSHWTSKGTPKRGYRFSVLASQEAAKLRQKDGHPMATYKCGECGLYHVGRSHPAGSPVPCPICGRE